MSHPIPLLSAALAGVLLAGSAPATAGLLLPSGVTLDLASATFTEGVGFNHNCGASASGSDDYLPESVSLDNVTDDGQCVGTVLTSPTGPQLDIQLDVSGQLGGQAQARISYSFALVPVVDDAPMDNPVWVQADIIGHASVTSASTALPSNSAGFLIQIADPIGNPQGYFREYAAGACAGGDNASWSGCSTDDGGITPSSVDLNAVAVLLLPLGEELIVIKEGNVFLTMGSGGSGQVIADPVFTIAPGYFVDYRGVPTPTTDLYRIAYSDGINPVPLPAAAWLFGSGLLGLAGIARRRP
jgi:hypothetical protein